MSGPILVETIEPRRGAGGHWNMYRARYAGDDSKAGYGQTAREAESDLRSKS